MFWIMGAEEIFHHLAEITGSSFWHALSVQFIHPDWHGFAFYDLIFPLFLCLAGVATPYSIGKQIEKGEVLSNEDARQRIKEFLRKKQA